MSEKKNKKINSFALFAAMLLLVITAAPGKSAEDIIEIATPLSASSVPAAEIPADAIGANVQRMRLNIDALRSAPENALMRLPLESAVEDFVFEKHRIERSFDASNVWYAAGGEDERGVISISGLKAFGRFERGAEVYHLVPGEVDGEHLLYRRDPKTIVGYGDDSLIPNLGSNPQREKPVRPAMDAEPADEKTVVDLLLLYTNGFADEFPGDELKARLNFFVALANQSLENSQIAMSVRLVGTKEVQFTDEGSLEIPLNAMTDGSGDAADVAAFNGIGELRDNLGADHVSLIRLFRGSNDACGLAWLMFMESLTFSEFAYSVVQTGSFINESGRVRGCPDLVLAHELGHNWGSGHNEGDNAAFPFAVGHLLTPFKSIMSRGPNGETTVSHFSNPDITFRGAATGSSSHDNARSINETRDTVARLRPTRIPLVENDVTPPANLSGRAFVNEGARTTNRRRVTIDLIAEDDVAVTHYLITENARQPGADDSDWTAIEAPAQKLDTRIRYRLSSDDGRKKVFVYFRDAAGNVSQRRVDRIVLK